MDLTLVYLAVIAAIDVALSITIQRRVSNVEKTYLLQSKTKKHMSDLQEMMKRKAGKEELSAKQQELNKALSDHTMHQMRSMPILLVISVAVYFLILPSIFPSGTVNTVNLLVTQISYGGFKDSIYFIIFTVAMSLSVQLILGRLDKKRFDSKYSSQPSPASK